MKVSIITVVFNAAATIEDSIKSVRQQTHPDIEHIIIDGGSTDGTLEILKKYRYRIHKYISEPDNGIYDAMNKGIKLSTGNIVATLNSNDIYADQTVVAQMVEFIQSNGLDAAYGDLVYVDHDNTNQIVRFWKAGEYRTGAFRYGWAVPHPTFFCQREVYEKFGCFRKDMKIASDFELMLRFIERYQIKVGYLPKVIVKMRIGGKANILQGMIRGNWEIIKSFRLNDLRLSPWFFIRKPITKISQLFKRPSKLNNEDIGL